MWQGMANRAAMASKSDRKQDNHPVMRHHELHAEPSAYSDQASKLYHEQAKMTDDGQQVYNLKISHKNQFRTECEYKSGPHEGQQGWPVPEFTKHMPTDVGFDINHAMAMPTMKPDQGMDLRQTYKRVDR